MAGDGRRGTFITFEGGEGSGKSTVAERAAARLREQGHDVLLTREPEGTELGRHMWAFFRDLAAAGKNVTAEAELFLFAAARAEHTRTIIAPAVDSGRVVLCDRFADSTTAYQGYGRGVDLSTVEAANLAACGGLSPDLTLILDVPVTEGLRRARALEADEDKKPDSIGSESP
ncbi:MAG: dTMP kinase, partial [Chloroflexi bacterium]|nr:dTMP kinase [Chloroflexota bacterium]